VALVVFLFMGSFRTVIVPLLAMPVSLIGACIAMMLRGVLAEPADDPGDRAVGGPGGRRRDRDGRERRERHVREGKGRLQAALVGARELFSPVIAMTITLAAVYAPIGFQGGLTGCCSASSRSRWRRRWCLGRRRAHALAHHERVAGAPSGGQGRGGFTRLVNAIFDPCSRVCTSGTWRSRSRGGGSSRPARWSSRVRAVPLYSESTKELAPTEDEGFVFTVCITRRTRRWSTRSRACTRRCPALLSIPRRDILLQRRRSRRAGSAASKMKDWNDREPHDGGDPAARRSRKLSQISGVRSRLVRPAAAAAGRGAV
jgi:multidrug efflux pump